MTDEKKIIAPEEISDEELGFVSGGLLRAYADCSILPEMKTVLIDKDEESIEEKAKSNFL